MFYVLFKKVMEKVEHYDKCSKNPFEKNTHFTKEIKFKDKASNEPAKTYIWIDKDD